MIAYYDNESDEARELLQELYDNGLLWAVNHGVLHQHGYAVGISSNHATPEVAERLVIIKIEPDDQDGVIIFAHDTGLKGYKKFLDYLHRRFTVRRASEQEEEGEVEH